MRRAVAFGLLALGVACLAVSAAPVASSQPTTPPTTAATSSPSTTSAPTTPGAPATAARESSRLPALGEGFPWIPVGVGVAVAGLIGARLRRAARR